ncbi:MAG: hypothetical protein JXR26_08355 [Balneolaceae bacterium]|nr:hypothetical protein [Balneolaceae bacterium]
MFGDFAAQWFTLYYLVLGIIFFCLGIGLMIKTDKILQFLQAQSRNEQPPHLLRTILKYFFLFTLPGLVLSFFPFSWPELLFSLWSLIIIYVAGIQLVRWPQTRKTIINSPDSTRSIIFKTGAIMLAVSPVMFMLAYLVIRKLTL